MNAEKFNRIVNYYKDSIEDLRLHDEITRDQEDIILCALDKIIRSAKYKNPFKVKNYDQANKENLQPISSMIERESITDLEEFCCKLDVAYARLLQKLEDRETYLKKMNLITADECMLRNALLKRIYKMKVNLLKECSQLSGDIKKLNKIID